MVLAFILVLMYRKSAKPIYVSCFVVLSVFGIMSVSKSFLVCWLLLIVCWFVLSVYQGVGKIFKFLMIALICSVVIYLYAYDSINTYLFRLVNDNSGSLESITTGRTGLWKSYIDAIFNDVKILFLGNGLNTTISSGRGSHNTFLESIFSLGIAGSGLLFISIKSCTGKTKFKPIMLIPIMILVIRMLAIGILTYDNLWYYIAIIVCLFGYLGQHRTIWQEHSAKDFASYESYKRAGILYVFPPFITARMRQKIGRRPQTQLCGDALEKSESEA